MDIDYEIEDAIMELPLVFTIGEHIFSVYPLTLGKTYLLKRVVTTFGLEKSHMMVSMELELLRVVQEHKQECCDLLSYMTSANDYDSVFDVQAHNARRDILLGEEESDLASLLAIVLSMDKTDAFMKHLGIDKENEEMRRVIARKDADKSNLSFGGVSLYGCLIDSAMERYSLTKRQVVWEIDYTSLRLLLADRTSTIYLNEKERKRIRPRTKERAVNGDSREETRAFIKSHSWE